VTADPAFWSGRRVLLTGHTGFKGAWLALWLSRLGAQVTGFSAPAAEPSLFAAGRIGEAVDHVEGDVRDLDAFRAAMRRARPEIVFHLAAQAIVRRALEDPVETFAVNVVGTAHVLEAVRRDGAGVRAVVCVTSDKCYANRESARAHSEDDALGGDDPYSASKAAQELVTGAYRESLLEGVRVATARAGNVIGGGDWGRDRLVPDLVRAAMARHPLHVRHPDAVRPWQHVLNPLEGYLRLAEHLAGDRGDAYACAWNFGPADDDARTVRWLVERLREAWPGEIAVRWHDQPDHREAAVLRVDSSRARKGLGWRPRWDLDAGLDATVAWYAAQASGRDAREACMKQIEEFERA
jgi:CDP-glucose 4,6-dehydratase